jgi:hypothetical protein
MNQAALTAVKHIMRDANQECLDYLRKGDVKVDDAIKAMSIAFVELAVINTLSSLRVSDTLPNEAKEQLLAAVSATWDEYYKRLAS